MYRDLDPDLRRLIDALPPIRGLRSRAIQLLNWNNITSLSQLSVFLASNIKIKTANIGRKTITAIRIAMGPDMKAYERQKLESIIVDLERKLVNAKKRLDEFDALNNEDGQNV